MGRTEIIGIALGCAAGLAINQGIESWYLAPQHPVVIDMAHAALHNIMTTAVGVLVLIAMWIIFAYRDYLRMRRDRIAMESGLLEDSEKVTD